MSPSKVTTILHSPLNLQHLALSRHFLKVAGWKKADFQIHIWRHRRADPEKEARSWPYIPTLHVFSKIKRYLSSSHYKLLCTTATLKDNSITEVAWP